jgi:hypothetical protein
MSTVADSKVLPRALMLSIAVAQGLLLFALYKAFDANVWPSESPLWSYPLWSLAIAVPVLLLLSLERGIERRVFLLTGGFAVILAVLALYTGRQAEPFDEFPVSSLSAAFGCSIAIACFKALMYLQQRAGKEPMSYAILFTYSWRNFLVLALAALFVLAFWLILFLWGRLFKIIEIDFFHELFRKDWFLFPVLGFAHGLGVIMFRELTRVIDSITRLLRGLIKLLLPLVVLVAVIFLFALPFTGLDALWATRRGTALLLWLTAVILFFTNAVYQDGRGDAPYPAIVHRAIYIGLFALPLLCALSFYGLALRLNQYGWTVARGWGLLVWLVLTLFSAGYVWGIASRRSAWPETLGWVNTKMGLVVLALVLLANSPVFDFRKISLNSQLARVESGQIPLKSFDFFYVHNQLARPGYLALERIKTDIGDSDPELLALIEYPRRMQSAASIEQLDRFWADMIYRPGPFEVPHALRARIEQFRFAAIPGQVVMIRIDLDADGRDEYVLVQLSEHGARRPMFFYEDDDGWQQGNMHYSWQSVESDDFAQSLKEGAIELENPRYMDLRIGEIRLSPN